MKLPFPAPMILPPPLHYVLAFVAGRLLDRAARASWALPPAADDAGLALIVLGGLITLPSAIAFVARKTTLKPHGEANRLVTGGTYRFTRNPMYLGLTTIYLGATLQQDSLWPLLLLVLPMSVMNFVVIPFEERKLKSLFGAEYEAYRARVRRWV